VGKKPGQLRLAYAVAWPCRWTSVRIKQVDSADWPDSLGGASAPATIMTFVQRRLRVLEMGTYMHHTWTPESSKEFVAKLDTKTFKR
jgi:hypothetical protein